jgi:SAM-dependent methyltransferase
MMDDQAGDTQTSYDRVAREYAERIFDELKDKPLDRELLDRFADSVRGRGLVCDLGCGPGHVARYLHDRGVLVVGVDLSPGMLEQARRLNPDIEFRQGNMLALQVDDDAWIGIAAFYSLIHIPRAEVVRALSELKRVLRPGGCLLQAFHVGEDVLHRDEWFGESVSVDFHFFRPEEMEGYLESAGFQVEETIKREPYPNVEHPSQRAYIFARKPPGSSKLP